ncbi:Cystinosin -like protein [Halotydeus destructor]|nr:Cystinosin -like protein [Halotydeus destructor]
MDAFNSTLMANDGNSTDQITKSATLTAISVTVGWLYFAAWSISFYPQVFTNYKRKSVVGLSFDFLALNLTGFSFYLVFNYCLYFIPSFQDAYRERHGANAVIPVELNDLVFAMHAVLITLVTISQCIIYPRGPQRVAHWAIAFLTIAVAAAGVQLLLAVTDSYSKLDFVYYLSYVKLGITIIKYIPQAWYNFQRKSTLGWSIGNILLDFTGGSLSILQMCLDAYNHDDYANIFGNPTKFGLGLFSILFDILFIVQHYVLYKNSEAFDIESSKRNADESETKGSEHATSYRAMP